MVVKPTQLRNIIFGKQLQKKEFDILKLKLDAPCFKTAVVRLFAMDMQARGTYMKGSEQYTHIESAIVDFIAYFRKRFSSEMGWSKSDRAYMKTMFAIAFGCGEFCSSTCSQAHIDV